MWGAYHPRRKSSSSSIPSNGQIPYSSALIESPASTNRTFPDERELNHQPSLPRVDEDSQQSSTDGLVARDYAPPPETAQSVSSDHHTQHTLSDSFIYTDHAPSITDPAGPGLQRPPTLHRRTSPEKVPRADLLPPPSPHDAFVGQFITPMIAATADRPAMIRSSSAPGSQPQGLQPSPLKVDAASLEGKPLFDVFNANISSSAEEMVKVLKGHLEGVLRVQEEIGRLHLGLEKIGQGDHLSEPIHGTPRTPSTPATGQQATPPTASTFSQTGSTPGSAKKEVEEAVLNREKGVDSIMERLEELSNRLRSYHSLGTPQLSFPQSGNTPVSARGHVSRPSLDPSSANIRRGNSQKGVPPYSPLHPSPLRQGGGGDSSTGGSSMLSGKRSQSHIGLASQGVPAEQDIAEKGVEHDDLYFKNFKMSADGGSPGKGHVAKQPSRGDEAWFEHTRPRSRAEGSPRSMRDDFEADRSRPW